MFYACTPEVFLAARTFQLLLALPLEEVLFCEVEARSYRGSVWSKWGYVNAGGITMTYGLIKTAFLATSAVIIILPGVATAQQTANTRGLEEVIVTARKRDETALATPVVLTAVSGSQLEQRAISKFDDLMRVVPQLQIGSSGGTVQGGYITIRGLTGSENNPFADQAVSFNIDGVQVGTSTVRRIAEMDIGQIEVLKGPQALFFGKNSPGGIISIRSADPTPNLQAKATIGYEFDAREVRGDGFVSGPITDTLGGRLAVFGSTMRGYATNELASGAVSTGAFPFLPKPKEWGVRGTLKWEPNDRFDARLKVNFHHLSDVGINTTYELTACPYGAVQGGGPDDCTANGRQVHPNPGAFLSTLSDRYAADGNPFLKQNQTVISYEMNYKLTDQLKLTSVSGYYNIDQAWADSFNAFTNLPGLLTSGNVFGHEDISEEVRLASDYKSWFNFMTGAYYQSSKIYTGNTTFIGVAPTAAGVNPNEVNNYLLHQSGKSYSFFGQIMLKPIEQIEIDGGGRYSHETKTLTDIVAGPVGPGPTTRVTVPANPAFRRNRSWNNFSPEATISYRPTADLTVFGSYKQGFLSGGFNSGATNFNSDLHYNQQVIRGFEGGVKARLLDGALRTDLTAYRYVVSGLQINQSITPPSGATIQTVVNAGKVTLKGVEWSADYKTPLQGVSLHSAVGYNNAKYNVFSVNCFAGMTQQEGCNYGAPTASAVINGTTYLTYATQNLAGRPLVRAPLWTGNIGTTYETDLGSKYRLGMNLDMTFSSSYWTNVTEPAPVGLATPPGLQKSYQMLDAGVRVGTQDDKWELSLIGKNLTNAYYALRSNDSSLEGSGTGRSATDPRGRVLADTIGAYNRGREIWVRLTARY